MSDRMGPHGSQATFAAACAHCGSRILAVSWALFGTDDIEAKAQASERLCVQAASSALRASADDAEQALEAQLEEARTEASGAALRAESADAARCSGALLKPVPARNDDALGQRRLTVHEMLLLAVCHRPPL